MSHPPRPGHGQRVRAPREWAWHRPPTGVFAPSARCPGLPYRADIAGGANGRFSGAGRTCCGSGRTTLRVKLPCLSCSAMPLPRGRHLAAAHHLESLRQRPAADAPKWGIANSPVPLQADRRLTLRMLQKSNKLGDEHMSGPSFHARTGMTVPPRGEGHLHVHNLAMNVTARWIGQSLCVGHSKPADRAMVRLNAGPKRCH